MFYRSAWIFTHYLIQDFKYIKPFIKDEDLIIGVDRGIEILLTEGVEPHLFVGDFDSLPKPYCQLIENNPATLKAHQEKDETDTELALNWCVKNHISKVFLVNDLQKRMDHILGTLSILEFAHSLGIDLTIISKNQELSLAKNHQVLDLEINTLISLCPLSDRVEKVKTQGLKYPLNEETLFRNKTRGISNVVFQSPIQISKGEGILLIIINRGEYDE